MKKIVITFLFLALTINTYSQNDSILKHTFNKENVVASAIDGTWKPEKADVKITFRKDIEVLNLIPKKFYKFLKNKTIYHAGFIVFQSKNKKYPFVLIEHNGNPHLVFFRKRKNEPYGDAESFNLFIAKGKDKSKDQLFIGGDFNNQAFNKFIRVE